MRRRAWATGLVLGLALTGCGSSTDAATSGAGPSGSPSVPSVTDISGEVVVTDLDAIRYVGADSGCLALAPHAQVRRGARVVVRSDTGSVQAVTSLDAGRLRREGTRTRPAGCVFGFDYSAAAAGRPTYTVRAAGLPPVGVTLAQLTRVLVRVP